MTPLSRPTIQVDSWLSEDDERSLANDVLDGLTKPFKELAPKHFYDARGSELFERITEQPEYYPTRTETATLRDHAAEIIGVLDLRVEFAPGEELRTEISAKFTRRHVADDLDAAGLALERWFTDDEGLFGISLARPRAAGGPSATPSK